MGCPRGPSPRGAAEVQPGSLLIGGRWRRGPSTESGPLASGEQPVQPLSALAAEVHAAWWQECRAAPGQWRCAQSIRARGRHRKPSEITLTRRSGEWFGAVMLPDAPYAGELTGVDTL